MFLSDMKFLDPDQHPEYQCPSCGEVNEILFDPTAGPKQVYTEDCAICCRPNVLTVTILPDGSVSVIAEPEQ